MRRTAAVVAALLSLASGACSEGEEALDRPTNVAFGARGEVYVADGYNHARIARFAPDGTYEASFGEKGFARGQLDTPHGIATDPAGRIYVADRENARVQVFDAEGRVVDVWQGPAIGRPWGIARAPDGTFFVVDGGDQDPKHPRSGIVHLTAEGRVIERFGRFGRGPGELAEGHAITVGSDGSVFVTDLGGRVQRFRRRGAR